MKHEVCIFVDILWEKSHGIGRIENSQSGECVLSLNLPQTYAALQLFELVREANGAPTSFIALHQLREAFDNMYQLSQQMCAYQYRQVLKTSATRRR